MIRVKILLEDSRHLLIIDFVTVFIGFYSYIDYSLRPRTSTRSGVFEFEYHLLIDFRNAVNLLINRHYLKDVMLVSILGHRKTLNGIILCELHTKVLACTESALLGINYLTCSS